MLDAVLRLAIALAAFLILPAVAIAGPEADRGKALAELHCARCHVVGEDRMKGISSTPSFAILIKALDDWHERFETFYARPPHPALMRFSDDPERPEHLPASIQEVILTLDDVAAIVAYAEEMAATSE